MSYVNGKINFVDLVDSDEFSVPGLDNMLQQLGYNDGHPMYYHFKIPGSSLDVGLCALETDKDVLNMLQYVSNHKVIEVYIEHWRTSLTTYFESPRVNKAAIQELEEESMPPVFDTTMYLGCNDSGHVAVANEQGQCSIGGAREQKKIAMEDTEDDDEDDEDSDFIVDEENLVDEVDVDMRSFHLNIDVDVEWVGTKEPIEDTDILILGAEKPINVDDFDSDTGDSDMEGSRQRKRALKKLRHDNKNNGEVVCNACFYVGQSFGDKATIKEMVINHSVETRRQLRFVKNDSVRVRVTCDGHIPIFTRHVEDPNVKAVSNDGPTAQSSCVKEIVLGSNVSDGNKGCRKVGNKSKQDGDITCPWVLHISKGKNEETWTVKTYKDTHKCLQTRAPKKCTSSFLSKDVEETIIPNPKVPVRALIDQLSKKYEVGMSYMKASRAKLMATEKVRGNYIQQYKLLRDYILELQKNNPGTTVTIDVEPDCNPSSETRQFRRIYICLGPLKQGFKAGLRELLGLDGTFMKGPFPGQLLTAVGLDANNGTYPLAYALVESETLDSWSWFLKCLADDLDLDTNSNFTFMSDRQKGIIPAIAKIFPCAEHRYCLKHIYDNMKSSWKGELFKNLLWKCATTTTVQHFNIAMEEVRRASKGLYEWLKKIPPRHWSRSHFTGRAHCDVLLNNMCEVFNRQLLDGRDKPVISALDFVREYLMKRIVIVQKVQAKCDGPLTPTATRMFEAIKTQAAKYKVTWNGGKKYQVSGPWNDQCVVDISEKVCTCRKWELIGMPCKHAVATLWDMSLNQIEVGILESWVHPTYWLTTWKSVYEFKVNPVNGSTYWPKSPCPITLIPPKHRIQVGRPKKNRRKSYSEMNQHIVNEGKLSRVGKSVTCAKCKKYGHNQRSCKGQEDRTSSKVASTSKSPKTSSKVSTTSKAPKTMAAKATKKNKAKV